MEANVHLATTCNRILLLQKQLILETKMARQMLMGAATLQWKWRWPALQASLFRSKEILLTCAPAEIKFGVFEANVVDAVAPGLTPDRQLMQQSPKWNIGFLTQVLGTIWHRNVD